MRNEERIVFLTGPDSNDQNRAIVKCTGIVVKQIDGTILQESAVIPKSRVNESMSMATVAYTTVSLDA